MPSAFGWTHCQVGQHPAFTPVWTVPQAQAIGGMAQGIIIRGSQVWHV